MKFKINVSAESRGKIHFHYAEAEVIVNEV